MSIRYLWVQILMGPFLVALYAPDTIPVVTALSGVALFISFRAHRTAKKRRALFAITAGLCLYVLASQVAAFFVDRADRKFQSWLSNHAGVRVGMSYEEALIAASKHALLEDPPYHIDTAGNHSIHDFIVVPKSLAILNLKRSLDEGQFHTLRIVTDHNSKVIKVNRIRVDSDSRLIFE